MWHEARKQEKKVRGMIVDYKRRAERRREFYEKIRRDPAQFLQIHGSSAKIHMDSSISTAAESCLMPWRGDEKNMIDRFDVRAHLDTIVSEDTPSVSTHNKGEIEKDLASEKQINYERWRTLIQNEFLGIPESKALHQIWLEERFGMNQPSMTESPTQQNVNLKKKLAEKKAKIGYNYDKPEDNKNIIVKGESSSSEEDSDSDEEFDTTINIETLTLDQTSRLNSLGTKFGLGADDFVSFAEEDLAEAERIRIAKELENEKSMFSGRKSRRERRALKERRMLILRANNAEENVKPIVSQGTSTASKNKSESSSESSESEVDEAKIEFITCFGGSSDEGVNDEEQVKKDGKNKSNKKKDHKNSKSNANKKPTLIEFGPSLPPEIEQKILAKPSFKISPSKDITPPPRRSPSVRRSVTRSPDFSSRRERSRPKSFSRSPSMARKFSRMRDRSRNRKRSRSKSHSRSHSRSRSRIFNTRMRSFRHKSRERRNCRKKSHSKSRSQSRSCSRSLSRSRSKSRSKSRRDYHSSRRRYRHGRANSRSLSRSCSRSFSRSPRRDHRKRGRSRDRSRNRRRNRDGSRNRNRTRSRSRSRRRNRGRNRSRSLSRSRSCTRSRSRSRSRRRSRTRSRDRRNKDRLRRKSRSRSRSSINKRRRRKSTSRSHSRVRGRSRSSSQRNSKTKIDDKSKSTKIDSVTSEKNNSQKETQKRLNPNQSTLMQHNQPDNESNLEIKLPDESASSQFLPLDIPMPSQPNEQIESLEQIEPPKEKISSPSAMDISPLKESIDNQESTISKDNSNAPGVTHDVNSEASTSLARQSLPLKRYYRHDLVDESSGPELDEEVDEEPPPTEKLSPRVANSVNTSTSKAGNSFKALTDKMKKKTQALIERQYKLDKAAEREKREKHGSDREKRESRRYRPRRRSRSRSRSSSRSGKYHSRSRSYSRSSSSSSRGFTKSFSRSRSRSSSSSYH